MLEEPRSGRLVAWANATIAGHVAPDDAAGKVLGSDTVHHVEGLPSAEVGGRTSLAWGLGRLRGLGARGCRLALPVPGHPLGLSGPPEFNLRAIEAGEAVLVDLSPTASGLPHGTGLGLVPEVTVVGPPGDQHVAVVWHCQPVQAGPPADVPTLGEAERELNEALREATRTLTTLDVAGSGTAAQAALAALRDGDPRTLLAPGYPARAVRVLQTAQRVAALVEIATGGVEHGAAVSATQMTARTEALREVARTARRAQVAAYGSY